MIIVDSAILALKGSGGFPISHDRKSRSTPSISLPISTLIIVTTLKCGHSLNYMLIANPCRLSHVIL